MKMGLGDVIDKISIMVILGCFAYGIFDTTSDLGGIDAVLAQAIENPTTYGMGSVFFALGFDIWIPAYPASLFGFFEPIMRVLYFYSGGYVPSFSIWVFASAIIVAGISTFLVCHFWEWSLFGKAGLFALVVGSITYYVSQFVAWLMLGKSSELLGIDAYAAWESSVNATLNPLVFWLLLATIPFSAYAVGKRVGGYFF